MPNLFGIEVDEKKYGFFKGSYDDTKILIEINRVRTQNNNKERTWPEIQRFLLNEKKPNNWTEIEKKVAERNTITLTESEEKAIAEDLRYAKLQMEADSKKANEATDKPEAQKLSEKVNEKKEEKEAEEKKHEEEKEQKEAENQPLVEKTDVKAEKTDAKKTDKVEKKELKKEVVESANVIAEKTSDVQKNLGKLADGKKAEPLTKEELIKGMMDMQNGMLPQRLLLQYLQSLAEAKERNVQKNGALEEELLQDRRNTIKDIGDEYKAHREVTPDLVEKKEELGAIDNLLINVTKYPKVLFITLILMGLNPFLAIGLSVLAAFSKDMVQDIYKDLPEKDRSNLENKPAQKPQPVDNPQIEEYQKKLADAQQTMQERELAFRKLTQKSIIMRQMLLNMCSQMLQQAKNKMSKAEEKTKPKAEEKKPVSNEKEAGAVKNNAPEKQEVKKEKSSKTL